LPAVRKWIIGVPAALLVVTTAIAGGAWWALRGSLPQLDGSVAARSEGPQARVVVERDAEGIPTIRGETFDDVAYGLGYSHAQDRFFQMDLSPCSAKAWSGRIAVPACSASGRWRVG
jgi:penicillin amidase